MKKHFIVTVILSLVAGVPLNSPAAPNKEVYELEERCGKQATKFFQAKYGDGYDTSHLKNEDMAMTSLSHFSNHYNIKSNSCFILITTSVTLEHKKPDSDCMGSKQELWNINENNQLGFFYQYKCRDSSNLDTCRVSAANCKSQGEWELLIRPYMNDAE